MTQRDKYLLRVTYNIARPSKVRQPFFERKWLAPNRRVQVAVVVKPVASNAPVPVDGHRRWFPSQPGLSLQITELDGREQ